MKSVLLQCGPSHGYSERALAAAEKQLGRPIPARLRDVYRLVGKHPAFTKGHNQLVAPERLAMKEGLLIFQRECQGVCSHAFREADLGLLDPPVKQRSQRGEFVYDYSSRFSSFIVDSICWEAVMYHGRANGPYRWRTDAPTLARLVSELTVAFYWPGRKPSVRLVGMDVVVCAFTKEDSPIVELYGGSPRMKSIERFVQHFGPLEYVPLWK
jgi:hypothetical protein